MYSTLEQLNEKYGFKDLTVEDGKVVLNPIYKKWLPACWIIQEIYGHCEAGNISLGKARELTAAVIEAQRDEQIEFLKQQIKDLRERYNDNAPF